VIIIKIIKLHIKLKNFEWKKEGLQNQVSFRIINNVKLFTIFLIRRYKQPNYFIRQAKMALKLVILRKIALEFQTL
jgi:hypothetical protein